MNRNAIIENDLCEISSLLLNLDSKEDVLSFLNEVLTVSELNALSKRWQILKMLKYGHTQRDISKELNVSLCKVTRGSRVLKDETAVVTRYLADK